MLDKNIEILQKKLDYRFKNIDLLKRAMTHSSTGAEKNYERLEFLGDRVLGLVIAHYLWELFPQENEGDLAKRHSALVQGKTLAQIAREIDLGELMHFSEAERSAGGAQNDNIIADGMESLIGALYVDAGMEVPERIIKKLFGNIIHIMKRPPQDPKTALQEWAQGRGLPLPTYELSDRNGPDHAPQFQMKVTVEGYPPTTAIGTSRRKAEKEAAAMLLAHLEEIVVNG